MQDILWITGKMPYIRQKGITIMEYSALNAKKGQNVEKFAKTQCVITIRDGKGRGKIYLSCDSWKTGTALLEQAMIQLDSIGTGLRT